MKVCINGSLIEHETARIDPLDRGFTLGDGIFETIAVRRGAPKRLAAHLARLRQGADVLAIPLRDDDARLATLISETVAANRLTEAAVRITLTRGPNARGIAPPEQALPTLVIIAGALPPEPEPARVIVASTTRRNQHSPLSRIKSLAYADNILARLEAIAAGADDAVLLNTAGDVAEGTVGNIFLLVDGGLFTPRVEDGALPGVMRADIIKLTRAEQRVVNLDMIERASEIFFTNALGIRPVIYVGGRAVGDGMPGLITQLLATRV